MVKVSFVDETASGERDAEDLARELLLIVQKQGSRERDWASVVDALDAHPRPGEFRLRVAIALSDEYLPHALISALLRGVRLDQHLDLAAAFFTKVGESWVYHATDLLAQLVDAWLRAGREIPGPVAATIRRMARQSYRADEFLDVIAGLPEHLILNPGEAWADQALADLSALGGGWRALIAHALTATSAKPSKAWEKQARLLLDAVDDPQDTIIRWLALTGRPRTVPIRGERETVLDPHNVLAVRGLVWTLTLLPASPESARVLGDLVETALRKVPGVGPRNPLVANAAVHALSRMEGDRALAQLARLASRVTYKGTLKLLDTALDTRAAALGLTRDEVEELAVPSYGLTEVGRRTVSLGDVTAELTVTGITWRNAAGRAVKSPPASVRREHAEELAELKASVKDIGKMLSAQVERLDRQFLAQRAWPYTIWRERYLDHPLVGTLGRRLIWTIDDRPCAYAGGRLRAADDTPVTPAEDATVRLWHPIGRDVPEVLAWRDWLERHEVTQPFKQAHREIYLLTAAEENTGVYSNRYAAHVLRQHQFHALAAARGWHNRLRLMVDDAYTPAFRELPEWGLRAEFWVEGIGHDFGTDTLDSGAYLRLVTDQVRFYPSGAPANYGHASGGGYEQWLRDGADPVLPLPLDQVPPLVFSEVMRDVDLFVGVASVGNDPTWQDGGPDGRFREYWTSYSFGELSGTAQTRRDLLSRLVPRLAIADRCTLEDRFLLVRGDIRTYKIHLGSGNILMTPNDQYLCIVPKQAPAAGAGQVFLPFEGDRVLAVILSKAMLLADDTTITDPTITRQLRL
ncbi:DUF4132 domain-containing protein [Nonomuraea guangzhouensis]|uniref:DUF4132 domain-containing protein n=1 Tax=Nonomuraea guangzhouensis TaxID=1291555 RepID=A0ABW4G199_9ACTN|nr:DUF4132 domain-containing protein [Nonomuraea guangzhouensis]